MSHRKPITFLLIPLSVTLQAIAAVMGKFASLEVDTRELSGIDAIISNPWYLGSLFFLGLQAITWQLVMRNFPLSWAYFFNSMLYVLILVSGVAFFGETVTTGNIVGTLFIVSGIVLMTSARSKADNGDKP